MFVGPDYSIIHPGLYPHNVPGHPREKAHRRKRGWPRCGNGCNSTRTLPWGTEEFEANVPKDAVFPPAWADAKRRREAREILNEQFQLLGEATDARLQLLGHRLPARRDRGGAG